MRSHSRSTSESTCDDMNTVRPRAAQLEQQLVQRALNERIEPLGRLVEDQQRRIRLQRLDESELALHPGAVGAKRPPEIRSRQLEPIRELQPTAWHRSHRRSIGP